MLQDKFSLKKVWSRQIIWPLFLKFSYLGVLLIGLIDVLIYFGAVKNNLGISPLCLATIIGAIHLIIRLKFKQSLSESFAKINLGFIVPVLGILPAFLFLFEEYGPLYPNYFFTNFGFHYLGIFPLAIIVALFGFIHVDFAWLKRQAPIVYFYSCLAIMFAALMTYYIEPELYKNYTTEDGLVENLTAISYFVAAILTILLSRQPKYWARSLWLQRAFQGLFILAGAALMLVGAEEISWGQRIIGFETPESIAIINRQSEVNLHNSEIVWPYVYLAYSLIGIYGMSLWLVRWSLRDILPKKDYWKRFVNLITPSGYLFFNFAMITLYVWLREHHGPWKYQGWEELSEIFLAIGIVIHLGQQLRQKRLLS